MNFVKWVLCCLVLKLVSVVVDFVFLMVESDLMFWLFMVVIVVGVVGGFGVVWLLIW